METRPIPTQEQVPDLAPGFVPDWEHRDYDDKNAYYSDATYREESVRGLKDTTHEWDIKTDKRRERAVLADADTEPITKSRKALEAVEKATTLKEALQAYDETYSLDAIEEGTQSPQLCAEMLLRINDKFAEKMSPEQARAVALETIAVGEAIGHLAEMPDKQSLDRTSLDGLAYMARIMNFAQTYAPGEIDSLEEGMLKVAERIDSRADSDIGSVSIPIRAAIDEFKHLPTTEQQTVPFTKIVTQINGDIANRTEPHVMAKLAEYEAAKHKRTSRKLAEVATGSYPTTKPQQQLKKPA